MSYEPIHHKYRPQTFADLVGQDAIATTLSNAIRLTRIAPAYLFTGPRGTGKTSSARILSKSLNCLSSPVPTAQPCGVCDVCQAIARGGALDVIEIDAASNTGVDNIRELIERSQFAPVQCRYKIYCLDEVHMLSTAAFNALLKTLEEPPDRVVFILATTDPQRVLPTIISRCQRFDFRRIPLQAMTQHLAMIAQTEQIAIASTALELVAQIAQGGLRDAESLLDQLSLLAGEITVERVWDLVGSVPEQDLLALTQAIAAANPEVILERTRYLLDRGREPLIVLQNLTGFYRDLLIAKTAPNRRDLVAVTEQTWKQLVEFAQAFDIGAILAGQQHLRTCEVQVKNTTQPRLWLEVTLLGLIQTPASTANASVSALHPAAAYPSIPSPVTSGPVTPSPPPFNPPAPSPAASSPAAPALRPNSPSQPAVSASPPIPAPAPPAASVAPKVVSPQTEETHTAEDEAPWPEDPLSTALVPVPAQVIDSATVSFPTPEPFEPTVSREAPPAAYAPPTPPGPVQPAAEPAVEPAAAPAELDLAQIWQQLLTHLNRPSQALLSEHGQLISFKGREAQIGIRNGSLARIAQSKLPDVESAFLKVFNRKVGVSLQIMTGATPAQAAPQVSPVPETQPQQYSQPFQPPAYTPPAIPSSPPPAVPVAPQTAPPPPAPRPNSPAPPVPAPPAPLPAPIPPLASASPSLSSVPAPPWETYDELTHSARNFAQFFNGALVNLDGNDPLGDAALPAAALLSGEVIESSEWEDAEEK